MTAERQKLPHGDPPPPTSNGHDTDALFAGVDVLCDQAVRDARANGAALAIMKIPTHTRDLVYATDGIAGRLDELQFTLGEGPCLDAYLGDQPRVHPHLDDLTGTSRWPTFAAEATALGVQSLFAFPVPGARPSAGPFGVLELYRRATGGLTAGQHAAAYTAATAIGRRLQTNWEHHLARFASTAEAVDDAASAPPNGTDAFTRTQVHVAAGILAVRLNIHPTEAVDRLRAQAYATGRRVTSVAADVIAHRLTLRED